MDEFKTTAASEQSLERNEPPPHDNAGSHIDEKDSRDPGAESQIQEVAPAGPPPPPNGGYGWVCTICVHVVNAHTWGFNSGYAVFLAYYLNNNVFPGATALQYAFVGSLGISCAMLISPLATIATRELGTRITMFAGNVGIAASFICASFATKMWHLFLTQGVLFGIGMGFLFIPSVGIVPQWFTTRRSLANGIGACGSGIGGIIYSLGTAAMIKHLGLAWSFRTLGIIAFVVNTAAVLLVRDRNKVIGSRQVAFDVALLKRPEYLLLVAYGWFSNLSSLVLIFSLAHFASFIGLNASQGSVVSAVYSLGQAFGRPTIGFLSDSTGRINMAVVTSLISAIFTLAVWIPTNSYGLLIFFALVSGSVAGTFWAVIAPITAEVVGLKNVPSALNLMWITIVLPCVFSEPIALQIIAGTGSFLGTQLWTGFIFVAAAISVFILRGWKIAEKAEIQKAINEAPEHMDAYKAENDEELSLRSKQVGRKRMLLDCWFMAKV